MVFLYEPDKLQEHVPRSTQPRITKNIFFYFFIFYILNNKKKKLHLVLDAMGGMMGCARLTITISRWSSSQNIVSVFVSWEMNASAFF